MSSLNVHDIKGLATFSNTVRIPSGHNLETYGEMVANGTFTVPRWTTNTRPSNPDVGSIGFNTDESVAEIYTGTENGWVAVGQTKNGGILLSSMQSALIGFFISCNGLSHDTKYKNNKIKLVVFCFMNVCKLNILSCPVNIIFKSFRGKSFYYFPR